MVRSRKTANALVAIAEDDSVVGRELTEKQRAFVEHYVDLEGKQRQAAIKAGYPEGSAAAIASRMTRNPLIQRAIAKQVLERIGLRAVTALRMIERLATSARSEYVRLEASKDLLDRAGFSPPKQMDLRLDASLSVHLDVGPSTEGEGG